MDINIYRTYNFDFDLKIYKDKFKEALNKAGIKKPSQFIELFKDDENCRYSLESMRSYFYGRRVLPLKMFFTICKILKISADEIAFPRSIQIPAYNIDITDCEDLFRNIFYPYNPPYSENSAIDYTEFFYGETYESDVDKLALILSRYNYLIQKYHYASVSKDELLQITYFTERYIIDRKNENEKDSKKILEWIRSNKDEGFLNKFYSKYTIGFYSKSCHSLLNILRGAIEEKFTKYAKQLLPKQDTLKE